MVPPHDTTRGPLKLSCVLIMSLHTNVIGVHANTHTHGALGQMPCSVQGG
jgi:hypothetical protein